jgi:hypothetical protein
MRPYKKNRQSNPKSICLKNVLFYHVLGRFSFFGEESSKRDLKKKLTSPVLFWPSRNQPTTSGSVFVWVPLDLGSPDGRLQLLIG